MGKCNKCGSTDVEVKTKRSDGEHGEGYVTEYIKCNECGHRECLGCSFA